MGRNAKKGLEYYPMDVDIVSDIKIRKLIKYHGGQALTVYTLLLCHIYKSGYFIHWDEDIPFVLSEQTGFDEEYIEKVVGYSITAGLFSEQLYNHDKVLTSKAIQERYSFICKQANRKSQIKEFSLISSDKNPISSEETLISSDKNPISSEESTQRKVKESKVKENKYNLPQEDINLNNSNTHARGGGNFKNLYQELSKHAQIPEDVWDAAAITGSFQNEWTSHYQQWLSEDEDTRRPLNELNNYLRNYCGDINTEFYHAMGWCKDNLMQDQYTGVYRIVTAKPAALTELRKCIKEIKKGSINQPGLFIFSKLNKL
jgi:hypothetical protein